MKKIELTANPDKAKDIEYQFSKYNLPFNKLKLQTDKDEIISYTAVAPDDTARKVVEPLSELIDTKQRNNFIVFHDLSATWSEYLNKLEEEQKVSKVSKLTEEFHEITEPAVDFKTEQLVMILIATTVAVIGLFLNNVTLIIGAMLLAPLLGPASAFAFNVAVARPKKMLRSAVNGSILIVSIVLLSALITILAGSVMELPITEEIITRTEITPVLLVLAILLGIAGGVALVSNIAGMLVGVAVAAALVPPAAVSGIGIALYDYEIFYGAFLLTISSIIGLILGIMTVFYCKHISPIRYYEKTQAKKYVAVSIISFVALFAILWFLVIAPYFLELDKFLMF